MTSDTKIGLLLGLIFIFVIAFVINGLPGFDRGSTPPNELTYNLASYQDTAPELGAREQHAQQYVESPYVSLYASTSDIRDQMELPSVDPVVEDQVASVMSEVQKNQEPEMNPNLLQKHQAKKANSWPKVAEVQKNDTLAAIAKRYYGAEQGNRIVNIKKIFEANRDILPSVHSLKVGQQLIIPPITPAASKAVEDVTVKVDSVGSPAPVKAQKPEVVWYEVKEDDSLWKIASTQLGNGGRYLEIKKLNAATLPDENALKPGMKLKMPVN